MPIIMQNIGIYTNFGLLTSIHNHLTFIFCFPKVSQKAFLILFQSAPNNDPEQARKIEFMVF